MTHRKRMSRFLMILVSVAVLIFIESPAQSREAKYLLKLGSSIPANSPGAILMEEVAQTILEKTEDQVQIEWYLGGILGDDAEMFKKTRLGQLDGGAWFGAATSQIVKEIQLLETPFFFNFSLDDYSEVDCTLEQTLPFWEKRFRENGFRLVLWLHLGGVYFLHKKPLETMEDLENMRLWSYPQYKVAEENVKSSGVKNLIPLSLPEVLTALQTGMVDTATAPPFALLSLQWYSEANYLFDLPINYLSGALVIREASLQKLPPRIQKVIIDTFRSQGPRWNQAIRRLDKEAYEGMLEHGIQRSGNPRLFSEIRKRMRVVATKMIGELWSQEFYDRMVSIRDRCRGEKSE